MAQPFTIEEIAKALFTVNKHAKTATQPKHLYTIKKKAIEKLLHEKAAKKIGLHFSENPKFSNQYSTLLIQVSDYYFHIPPSREDLRSMEHLGHLDMLYRNPKTHMSLKHAKKVLYAYIGWKTQAEQPKKSRRSFSSYYTPSSLGKMKWPPSKRFHAPSTH